MVWSVRDLKQLKCCPAVFNWLSCEAANCWLMVRDINGIFRKSIMSPDRLERSLLAGFKNVSFISYCDSSNVVVH